VTILITAVTGFVGSYLSEFLVSGGFTDICGTYLEKPAQAVNPNIRLHQLDITDRQAVMHLVDEIRPREVYHLAAVAATTGTDPIPYYLVNFNGTINFLEALRQIVPQCRVVYVGSANIYGSVPEQYQPIREERELKPVNHYAASKAAADLSVYTYAVNGMNVVRARPFNHTGPGQRTEFVCSRMAKLMAEIMLGQREPVIEVGNAMASRDFTDVRDVVRAYQLLMQKGCSGEAYNICSQQVYSISEIITILANWAGVKVAVRSRSDLMRTSDIDMLKGSREKITAETGWQPSLDFRRTLRDLLLYWEQKLKV
jgi:GDP-4-dehydro-6-deoxy-D-mannose reductase